MVTIFKTLSDTSTPFYRNVEDVLDRIKSGKSKDLVEKIRAESDKEARDLLKKGLPAICFCGEFTKRNDKSVTAHSGFVCLDFDNFESTLALEMYMEELKEDAYTFSVFVSPSGDGLKVLVRIPKDIENHKLYFNALKRHYNSHNFDVSSCNISRVCYESYDPNIHINQNSSVWEEQAEKEYAIHTSDSQSIRLNDSSEIIRRLKIWWEREYGLVKGERNKNIYILAMAFNEFGIDRSLAEYAMGNYTQQDFSIAEIKSTITSAYRKTDVNNTKFFEDTKKVNEVKAILDSGAPKKEVRAKLQEADISDEEINNVIETAEKECNVFWSKTDKGALKITHNLFKSFIEENGFFKYYPDGSNNYVYVRLINNILYNSSEDEIKDFILAYLMNRKDMSIYNYFADNTRFFKDDFLNMIATIRPEFAKDTKDYAFLYFKNCVTKIGKNSIDIIDYIDLGSHVWKEQIIDRDFFISEDVDCDYRRFVSNISGGDDRESSIKSTIGFLLHSHKSLGYCPAVIINDEVISEHPEGGTGKGIFVAALNKMKKGVVIDGKAFAFDKTFPYQLVSADTQLLIFDDVRKNFEFERLFSIVTEGITLEKKNKDAIKIPMDKSPKIIITTNYAIKGNGNSNNRRRWELEFKQFYNMSFTPEQDFGRMLFASWDKEDWIKFDNYMIGCLQLFLTRGLVTSSFNNIETRKFISETDHSFYEWIMDKLRDDALDPIIPNIKISKSQLFNNFVEEYPDFSVRGRQSLSQQKFYKWLSVFAIFKYKKEPTESRDHLGRHIIFNN
jgi:hypothetical protein